MYPTMADFKCPPGVDFSKELAGEYDIPDLEFDGPPEIIDIGACCGAFSVWAAKRWKGAKITCFEPIPQNFYYLAENVADIGASTFNLAVVGDKERPPQREARETAQMFLGKNNCGECSFYDIGEQSTKMELVVTIHASMIDGCELSILEAYPHSPLVILLEIHSNEDRIAIDRLMFDRGYILIISTRIYRNRWLAKYARKDVAYRQ